MNHLHTNAATTVALCLFGLMAIIQLLVAAHILPVTILWGSSYSEWTWKLCFASIGAAALLYGMATVIQRRSQISSTPVSNNSNDMTPEHRNIRLLSWIITFYMGLNTVGNVLSPNPVERYGFGTLTLVLCICCGLVSSSKEEEEEEENPSSTTTTSNNSAATPYQSIS